MRMIGRALTLPRLTRIAAPVTVLLAAAWLPAVVKALAPPDAQGRFVGTVTLDGQPAPSGAIVQARINDVVCGMTTVFQDGAEARYVLNVVADSALRGCGTD